MMVYVVTGADYGDYFVLGVFATRESAEQAAKEAKSKDRRRDQYQYEVEEHEVK